MLLLGKSICSRIFRFDSVSDGFSQRDGRKTSSEFLFEDRELPPRSSNRNRIHRYDPRSRQGLPLSAGTIAGLWWFSATSADFRACLLEGWGFHTGFSPALQCD